MTDASAAVDSGLWQPLAAVAKARGVSRQAVAKRVARYVEAGRLSTRPGPRGTVLVNIVAFDRVTNEETDPAQALRNGREPDAPAPAAAPTEDDAEAAGDEEAAPASSGGASPAAAGSYSAAKTLGESYKAENARLDLEERLGRLADRDETRRLTMDVFRVLRDRLLSIPARLQDRLAAAKDPTALRILLHDAIRDELDSLASKLDALEAGGGEVEFDDADIERGVSGTEQPAAPA